MQKTRKPASFQILKSSFLQITWKLLHENIYKAFTTDTPPKRQDDFLKAIFPENFYKVLFVRHDRLQKKYTSNVYRATDDAKPRFHDARDYLINLKKSSGENYRYDNCPVLLDFQKHWEETVPSSSFSETPNLLLEEAIGDLLGGIDYSTDMLSIVERLSALNEKHQYSQVLSFLSLIASSLFYFGIRDVDFSEEDIKLHTLVLPPLSRKEVSSSIKKSLSMLSNEEGELQKFEELLKEALNDHHERGEAHYIISMRALQLHEYQIHKKYLNDAIHFGYEPAKQQKNTEEAQQLLEKAKKIYYSPKHIDSSSIKECCNYCEKIIRFTPSVSDEFRGEASYILYKYILAGNYTSPSGETAEQYLEISHLCNFNLAADAWIAHNNFSITPQYIRPEVTNCGKCYSNSKNMYATTFEKTIPVRWGEKLFNLDFSNLENEICDGHPKRLLFIDNCFTKNLQDLLNLLEIIKKIQPCVYNLNIELFIRHNSDTARALIDTALSHIPEYQIPVYIIDDDKFAAQQLLSLHPLFFPISSVNLKSYSNKPTEEKPILHFIILGNTNVAEWLVREAFWMMEFRDNTVISKITILDTMAEDFETKIKAKYPGMTQSKIMIDGIQLPEIEGINVNFNSNELPKTIESLINETPYCYFAIATESDEANLTLAMRIREALIRTGIDNKLTDSLNHPSPIAYLCRNDFIAWSSKNMVIETEKQGNKWFNTWSLIPFGEISKCYSWTHINGGTFEQLAKCIHYQYSNILPDDISSNSHKALEAKKSYFQKQYNRDSSYCLALSMPYRIFQFRDTQGNQVVPIVWSILDTTVYSTVEQLSNLSKRINRFTTDTEYKAIAIWEHNRWVKWMLSRGWLPASFDDAVFAFNCGNPRQQLFVARLHPCICSYEDLKELSKVLLKKCGITKDFYTSDLTNIQMTKQLLSLKWLKEKAKEDESR